MRAEVALNGLTPDDIDRFICHPGGTKVLAAMESALSLTPGALDHERGVLADYGNMSSPTVLFVLERCLRPGPAKGAYGVAMAFGPGLTLESMLLRVEGQGSGARGQGGKAEV